jgi:hypothetical protein
MQQIVSPVSVGVGSEVGPILAIHYSDISPLPIFFDIERISSIVNRLNGLFPRPFPASAARPTDVSNALMRVVARAFIYAGNPDVGHFFLPLG